jgi:hypothetical protein
MSESPSKADLGHLVTGDKEVPTKVETDWALLQGGAGGSLASQLADQVQLSPKDNTVVRRYEFYKYTGAYASENHEALPVSDSPPAPGDVGNLIGNQMVALNLPGGVKADTTAPKLTLTTKVPATTKVRSLTVSYRATDPDSKSFSFYCSLDGAVPSLCKSTLALKNLAFGTHRLALYAADQANNASGAVTVSWKVTK